MRLIANKAILQVFCEAEKTKAGDEPALRNECKLIMFGRNDLVGKSFGAHCAERAAAVG